MVLEVPSESSWTKALAKLTSLAASSVASSSETSLVGASGYKFKKDERKGGKAKLKKPPAMKRKSSDLNGRLANPHPHDKVLRTASQEPKMMQALPVLRRPFDRKWTTKRWLLSSVESRTKNVRRL